MGTYLQGTLLGQQCSGLLHTGALRRLLLIPSVKGLKCVRRVTLTSEDLDPRPTPGSYSSNLVCPGVRRGCLQDPLPLPDSSQGHSELVDFIIETGSYVA